MRKRFQAATDKVWFTADLHFGHAAIINSCKRPFECEDDMDAALISNWNSVVGKRDHVFILGDFSFRSRKETIQIAKRLHGIKYLIEGNHDRMIACNPSGIFEGGVEKYHEIWVDKTKIVMCHFAFRSWNLMHYGSWNLHGHSHGNLPHRYGKQADVGVDALGVNDIENRGLPHTYRPWEYDELKTFLDAQPVRSEDHHQPKPESSCEDNSLAAEALLPHS